MVSSRQENGQRSLPSPSRSFCTFRPFLQPFPSAFMALERMYLEEKVMVLQVAVSVYCVYSEIRGLAWFIQDSA